MTAPLADAWVRVRPDTKGFAKETSNETSKAFNGLNSHFASLGKAAGIAIAGGAAIGGAALATMGVKTAAAMEQAQVAFTTLLGSGKEAQDFLGQLQKFAAATPFEFPGLVDASRQLLGVGASADSVIPTLTAFGDASGALGLNQDQFNHIMLATTQAMANGKLQAGDLLQITQAGLPVWKLLGEALGMPVSKVRELSSQGKLLTADVLPKLQAQMEKDYGGSMAKQSQTLNGLWSTFMDTLNMGMANVIGPFVPALKSGLTAAMTGLAGVMGGVNDFIHGFTVGVDGAKDPQTKAAQAGAVLYGVWNDKIKPALDALIPAVKDFAMTLAHDLQAAMSVIIPLMTEHIIPAFMGIAKVIKDDVMPIVSQIVRFVVETLVPAFAQVLGAALDAARGAFEKIGKTLHDHQKEINQVLHAVQVLAKFLLTVLVPVIKVALKVAFEVLGLTIQSFIVVISKTIDIFNSLGRVARAVWHAIRTVVTGDINAVKAVVLSVMHAIQSAWSASWNAVRSAVSSAWHSITSTTSSAVNTVSGLVNRLVGFFTGLPGRMRGLFVGMFDGIADAFKSAVNVVIDGWNSLQFKIPGFDPPGPGPKFGGFTLGVPDIPRLAAGGIVDARPGGTLINVGEAGQSERVTPLDSEGMSTGERLIANLLQQVVQAAAVVGPANVAAALNSVASSTAHNSRGAVPVY